jgi:hypothetical protein
MSPEGTIAEAREPYAMQFRLAVAYACQMEL